MILVNFCPIVALSTAESAWKFVLHVQNDYFSILSIIFMFFGGVVRCRCRGCSRHLYGVLATSTATVMRTSQSSIFILFSEQKQ